MRSGFPSPSEILELHPGQGSLMFAAMNWGSYVLPVCKNVQLFRSGGSAFPRKLLWKRKPRFLLAAPATACLAVLACLKRTSMAGTIFYGPPSIAFAGAVVRTNDAQGLAYGLAGSRFGQIVGSEKCRIEPLISEMAHLSMERWLIPIIRDADNHLCFFGSRTQADDPDGVLKFFTSYRVFRFLERCCRHYLLHGSPDRF